MLTVEVRNEVLIVVSDMEVDVLMDALTDIILGVLTNIGVDLLVDVNVKKLSGVMTVFEFNKSGPLEEFRC